MGRRSTRTRIGLDCSTCGRRNYSVTKNRSTTPEKLVLRKFCPQCGTHTEHHEGK
ncbi:MAG: 50S ribosomal protein L33 [Myxococcales bacterium]|nr:50S ribosomal protein L33 [Myxococcales bacterium]MCB9547435.1 50S ribosomal protein L33 [Myxococcales bacterium]